jgi:hypothetical protein
VGLPKTGTTHVQAALAASRERLRAHGVLYPRVSTGPQHFLPALDFLQMRFRGVRRQQAAGTWQELAEAVGSWPGRSVISHELLSAATAEQVGRMVDQLGPDSVHLVLTVRDLSRLLPAVWQERAKNGVVESWTEFRTAVAAGPDATAPHGFWSLHDAVKVLDAWRQHLPSERMHVITLPQASTDENVLLDRLAQVLGVDPSLFVRPEEAVNASIGALELAVLRQINAAARDRMDERTYQARIKRGLVPDVLAARPGQLKVRLPASDREWVERATERLITAMSRDGVEVIGDPAELVPANFAPDAPDDPAQSGEMPAEAVAEALAEVVVELVGGLREGKPFGSSSPSGRSASAERADRWRIWRPGRYVAPGLRALSTGARAVVRRAEGLLRRTRDRRSAKT